MSLVSRAEISDELVVPSGGHVEGGFPGAADSTALGGAISGKFNLTII